MRWMHMQSKLYGFLFTVFVIFAMSPYISNSIFTDPVSPGEEIDIYATIRNPTDNKYDSVTMTVFFLDWGDYMVVQAGDLSADEPIGLRTSFMIPRDATPGWYPVMLRFHAQEDAQDTFNTHIYREIYVR